MSRLGRSPLDSSSPSRSRADRLWLYAVGAGVAAVVVRAPFLTPWPATWDSVQYCLGVLHYDIALHQPHPPGYFLYVLAGKLIQALGLSPYASLVALSLGAGAVMAGVLTWWAGRLAGKAAAVATGALAVVSPLAWNYATTGDTYAVSGMMAAVVGWLCWRVYAAGRADVAAGTPQGPPLREVALSALALAVAGGMRPTDALFLFPLWLYCLSRRGGRAVGVGLAVLGAGTAAWVAPMLAQTGGLARYLEISQQLSAAAMRVSPWAGGTEHRMLYVAAVGLGALEMLCIGWFFVPLARGTQLTRRPWFLALWLAPATLFFAAVHLGQSGYLLLPAPALLLLAGVGLARVQRALPRGQAAVLLGTVIALNALFLAGAVVAGQRGQARCYRQIVQACAPYAGPDTVVLTSAGTSGVEHPDLSFRLTMYLLPTCDVFYFPLEASLRGGGGPNEGLNFASRLRTPPVVLRACRLLVAPSLLRYLPAEAKPVLVVSNEQGELWEVAVATGSVVLREEAVVWGPPGR